MPSGYESGLDPSNPTGTETVLRIEKPIYGIAQAGRGAGSAPSSPTSSVTASPSPSPTPGALRLHPARDRPDAEWPAQGDFVIGCYVDDLFTLFSHDDEHSIYHSFTSRLAAD